VHGADHAGLYDADVVAPIVAGWVRDTWPGSLPTATPSFAPAPTTG
jgi:hypothetical protein